jgi:hypothetical protein
VPEIGVISGTATGTAGVPDTDTTIGAGTECRGSALADMGNTQQVSVVLYLHKSIQIYPEVVPKDVGPSFQSTHQTNEPFKLQG